MQCRSKSVKSTGLNAISEGIVINHCQCNLWPGGSCLAPRDRMIYTCTIEDFLRLERMHTSGAVRGVIWP